MSQIYSTMLYSQKQLIVKTVEGKQPFVVAEVYSEQIAEQICNLLNAQAEKGEGK